MNLGLKVCEGSGAGDFVSEMRIEGSISKKFRLQGCEVDRQTGVVVRLCRLRKEICACRFSVLR